MQQYNLSSFLVVVPSFQASSELHSSRYSMSQQTKRISDILLNADSVLGARYYLDRRNGHFVDPTRKENHA